MATKKTPTSAAPKKTKATTAKVAKVSLTKSSTVKKAKTPVKKATSPAPQSLVAKYQTHDGDTGSTEVQIARISVAIDELAKHLKKHAKDFDSRRGLLIMVGKRRRLLDYLKTKDEAQYGKMITDLKLRK